MTDALKLIDGSGLEWPAKPTCHHIDPVFKVHAKGVWREPEVWVKGEGADEEHRDYPFRTCDYCGSISPQDLLELMQKHLEAVTLDMADWKYGWPHKFYVEGIPSGLGDREVVTGTRSCTIDGVTHKEVISRGKRKTAFCKFYTEHLADDGFNVAAFGQVSREIWRRSGLLFIRNKHKDNALGWRTRMPFDEELAKSVDTYTDPNVTTEWLNERKGT